MTPVSLAPLFFISRLEKLPLVDSHGLPIGRMRDVVITPSGKAAAPHVLGFVAEVQRRRIFVSGSRVTNLDASGVRLRGTTLDLRPFEQRSSELLASKDLLHHKLGKETVHDVALRSVEGKPWQFEVESIALRTGATLRRRSRSRIISWTEAGELFDRGPVGEEVAAMGELHPADVAAQLREMPLPRRRQLAEAMDDERLADLLEELPEDEQVKLVEDFDAERIAHVLEEMDPDDAVDFIGTLPQTMRGGILNAMDSDAAEPVRRLLAYDVRSAGGVMTPAPIVVTPATTVAEALARVRSREYIMALAAQVFVAEPPTEPPTGKYLGVVGFQRLLREAPTTLIADCLDDSAPRVTPDLNELLVAERLAAYDLFAMPVVDSSGRLLGAVTIDDVLDHALPPGWRDEYRKETVQ